MPWWPASILVSASCPSARRERRNSLVWNFRATAARMTFPSKFIFTISKDVKMVTRDQIVSQAQVIFREVLDSPQLVLTDDLTASKVKGWDSLNHVTLVMTLEEQFAVKFTTREVMGWRNVGQMLDCLEAKLNK